MPITAAPTRGYADWQRTNNWDSPTLFSDSGVKNATVNTAILDVSRFAYLSGYLTASAGLILMTISWFADPAGATALGTLSTYLDANNAVPALLPRLVSQGPFLQATFAPIGGVSFTYTVVLIASNRPFGTPTLSGQPTLTNRQAVVLAANATVTTYPSAIYAGPAQLNFFCQQACTVTCQELDNAGNYDTFVQYTPTANVNFRDFTLWPFASTRIQVLNNTANATSFYLVVTPTLTGAT